MFCCNNCGKEFKYKKNYKYHTNNDVCRKNSKYKCKLCSLYYKNKFSLKEHLIEKHNVDENKIDNNIEINSNYVNDTVCKECGKSFFNISNLNKHRLINCKVNKTQIINNGDNSVVNNNGTINYNTNNTNNYNNVNFNLNNFGEEKVDESGLIELIRKTNIFNINDLFTRYIAMKHIKCPENRNLLIKHRYGGQIYVFKGFWKKAEKDDTFHEIKIATIDDINDCISNNKELSNPVINNELDKLEYTTSKKFQKNINDILYKNKEVLNETYEKTKNYKK